MTGPIRLVLDTSAIVAYTDTSINVGETVSEVANEGCRFALPAACLVEASRRVKEDRAGDLLLLVSHPNAVVTSLAGDDWQVWAEWTHLLGRVDLAAAMVDTVQHDGWVLSGEPEAYGDWQQAVIPI